MSLPPKPSPESHPSQAGSGTGSLAPLPDALARADYGALLHAALRYSALRLAESRAASESAARGASASSAPSRAAVIAAERVMLSAAREVLGLDP